MAVLPYTGSKYPKYMGGTERRTTTASSHLQDQ